MNFFKINLKNIKNIEKIKNHDRYKILVSAYIDGELHSNDLTKLSTHLKQCPDCKKYLDEVYKLRSCIREQKSEYLDNSYDYILAQADTVKKSEYKKHFFAYAFATFFLFIFAISIPKVNFSANLASNVKIENSIWPNIGDVERESVNVYYYSDYV
jgi:predicted anti-sigma-YlaC factor YlaD